MKTTIVESPEIAESEELSPGLMNDRSQEITSTVAIVGMGYVGLPLSLRFSGMGANVIGLDVDEAKVDALSSGKSYIKHIDEKTVKECVKSGKFRPSTDFSSIAEADAVIICVPTPLSKNRDPDISFVLDTGTAIAPFLQPGTLVVLESTTFPGTTEESLLPLLEEGSGLKAGKDFHLAFSPEREDPGNPDSKVANLPKVVGGLTPACLEKAIEIYGIAIEEMVPVSSCRAAEATKLLENIFRSVNIALVNELKLICHEMGIDVWEIIEAAKTKPFGYMPFYPGPGLGGHCIPIDPFYLTWKAREYEKHTRFIELAGEINTSMPQFVVARVTEALNSVRKSVNGSRILVVGVAYKPDVDDSRESCSFVLMDLLDKSGADVSYFDPHIPVILPTRKHARWAGTDSVTWNRETVESYDLVLIATAHSCVDYSELGEWASCIVDTRNAMNDIESAREKTWKA